MLFWQLTFMTRPILVTMDMDEKRISTASGIYYRHAHAKVLIHRLIIVAVSDTDAERRVQIKCSATGAPAWRQSLGCMFWQASVELF